MHVDPPFRALLQGKDLSQLFRTLCKKMRKCDLGNALSHVLVEIDRFRRQGSQFYSNHDTFRSTINKQLPVSLFRTTKLNVDEAELLWILSNPLAECRTKNKGLIALHTYVTAKKAEPEYLHRQIADLENGMGRRDFLKKAAVAGTAAAGVAATGVGIHKLLSPDIEAWRAKLDEYKPMPWGRGYLDWADIEGLSDEEIANEVSNPALAVALLRLVEEFCKEGTILVYDSDKTEAQRSHDSLTQYFLERRKRFSYSSILNLLREYMELQQQVRPHLLTEEEFKEVQHLLGDDIAHIMWGRRQYGLRFRVFEGFVWRSGLPPEQKKQVFLSDSQKHIPFGNALFDKYTYRPKPGTEEHRIQGQFWDEQGAMRDRLKASNFSHWRFPVCEDCAFLVMHFLQKHGYPPLALYMSTEQELPMHGLHIVTLFKSEGGYHYISFFPNYQYGVFSGMVEASGPYTSVKNLMQEKFQLYSGCLVFDAQKTGLMKKTAQDYSAIEQLPTFPVKSYPD